MEHRPGLAPAVAEIRRALRTCLRAAGTDAVVLGLSGGGDSLALAAALAFEAPKAGVRAVAVVVDHGLQPGSAVVAARAADTARGLGLEAEVVPVEVAERGEGPEAAAREARRAALRDAAVRHRAGGILLAHTLDDQAETVLLGLARGSGAASLAGMAPVVEEGGIRWLRPLLGVRRAVTRAACAVDGLEPWRDPHNTDTRFARVRVRQTVLPALERELGPGVTEALARTADQLREDADAFAAMIDEVIEDIVEPAEAGIAVSVAALAANPAALRHRIIRHVVRSEFHTSLTRSQTLEVARLVTDWSGQGPIDLPGCRARRVGRTIEFTASDQAL